MFKNIDMTKGNILKCVLLFALPIFLGNILQQFYTITDTWVVGKYLENGISAIGSSNNIYDLLLCFANGLTLGFSLMVSRSFGAKDENKLKKSIALVISLTIIVTIILTTLGITFSKPLMRLLKTPDGVFDMAYSYISIILGGMITTMLYNMFQHLMRSVGNSFVSLICLSISVVLNILMDFVFVVIFKLGIKGVAIATVVAQGLSSLFCFIYII